MIKKIFVFFAVALLSLFPFLSVQKYDGFVDDGVGVTTQDVVVSQDYFKGSFYPCLTGVHSGGALRENIFVPWRLEIGYTDWTVSAYFGTELVTKDIPFSLVEKDAWVSLTIDSEDGNAFYQFGYLCPSDFNFNILSCRIHLGSSPYFGDNSLRQCTLEYFDDAGSKFVFLVAFSAGVFSSYSDFGIRTYYFVNSFTDNDYFNSGYDYGYDAGSSAGERTGYNDGFSSGKIVGYQNGYSAGVADANNYSFLDLIGAVFDAPVNTFVGLLNFDLLGFNMLKAFTGLITLAIIITFIRLVMGRK